MRQAGRMAMLAGFGLIAAGFPAAAQSSPEAATIAELRRQIEAMQRRLDQLEARGAPPARAPAPARAAAPARAPAAPQAPATGTPAIPAAEAAAIREQAAAAGRAAALDALRSDLPGIAFRVPGSSTQVRLYGWAKITAWRDFNGRNQSDAPPPSTIPLTGSAADRQGGDFGMTARFSRFGLDTRTDTAWGQLDTRIEGDFGGGAAGSPNAVFRLRQAWGELTMPGGMRLLIGQTNSLWNEGIYETIIDATNLNQSFIRQAQIRLSGDLGRDLLGQVSLEAPDTTYLSQAGLFGPDRSLDGGASPAFNALPDLHGRLTWRPAGWEVGLRGMLRQLRLDTAGTNAPGPARSEDALGWGLAAHARMPMRVIADWFGPDDIAAMAYYGEGIGRYFFGNTAGQDAVTNLGLPSAARGLSFDPLPSWGVTAAYRRFWRPSLRSNFAYSYARQDYPDYVLQFAPGSGPAQALNAEVQQAFVNLIWSPFASVNARGGVDNGWLDIGLEYLWTRRDLAGGSATAGNAGVGHGIANRVLFGAVARF
jgi:hypothetical protein